jgi:glycosyltransferase involved in cell wall biosynthesis
MEDLSKVSVVYFQQNIAQGACEEYFYLLMQGIDKNRFVAAFICPDDSVLDTLAIRVNALGIKVHRYSLAGPNCRLILRLKALFCKLKPQIAHFNDPCLNGIIAARLAGVPLLVMTHHTPELDRKYNWRGRLMERIAFRFCKPKIIFTSDYDKNTGIKKDALSEADCFVVHYGLPPERFIRGLSRQEIYKEFSLTEGCQIIGNVARLTPQKGLEYLIEAAPLIIEKFKSVKFFFVGKGELEAELKAKVKEKGLGDYFIFTGFRTDIPRLLSAFEILVMPSLFEGLCFSVIEASAMGVPVVATAVGGMRRSVIDGKTGVLVPPKDPEALAKVILWLLGHPEEAKQMGSAAKVHFNENFIQERMVRETEEFYIKWRRRI